MPHRPIHHLQLLLARLMHQLTLYDPNSPLNVPWILGLQRLGHDISFPCMVQSEDGRPGECVVAESVGEYASGVDGCMEGE